MDRLGGAGHQHDDKEYGEELNHCYREWGEPFKCDGHNLILEDNCLKYVKERSKTSPETTTSLYLSRIQNLPSTYKGEFKITNIKLKKHDENFSDYIVVGKIGMTEIEFRHAASALSWELFGLAEIVKINAVEISTLFPNENYLIKDCIDR